MGEGARGQSCRACKGQAIPHAEPRWIRSPPRGKEQGEVGWGNTLRVAAQGCFGHHGGSQPSHGQRQPGAAGRGRRAGHAQQPGIVGRARGCWRQAREINIER